MMGKREAQPSALQVVTLEELVPQGHFLRKLDGVLDLRFVPEFMQPAYPSKRGRPGVDTRLAVRMILLSYLHDLSDVRVCDEVGMHAGYRWFCRLDFHDEVPDRTTLVKFRKRCREHGLWEELFHRIVTQCRDVGLLSGRHLMADSTQVQASASIKSLREIETALTSAADRICAENPPMAIAAAQPPAAKEDAERPIAKDDEDHHHTDFHGKRYSNATHRSGTDPDAQLYRKGKGKESKLSYKAHVLADTKSRVIVQASATRVCGPEGQDGAQAIVLLDELHHHHGITPKTLCADTGYGNADTLCAVSARGVVPHIPLLSGKPPKIPVWRTQTRSLDKARKRREKLRRAHVLKAAWDLAATRGYQLSRKLRHRVEHLFGEAKQSHGLARARSRSLRKMNEQVILTATAQNLKRLVTFLHKPCKPMPSRAVVRPTVSLLTAITAMASSFRSYGRSLKVIIEALSLRHAYLQLHTT